MSAIAFVPLKYMHQMVLFIVIGDATLFWLFEVLLSNSSCRITDLLFVI